jgi:hypothetical protein
MKLFQTLVISEYLLVHVTVLRVVDVEMLFESYRLIRVVDHS